MNDEDVFKYPKWEDLSSEEQEKWYITTANELVDNNPIEEDDEFPFPELTPNVINDYLNTDKDLPLKLRLLLSIEALRDYETFISKEKNGMTGELAKIVADARIDIQLVFNSFGA